LGMAVQFQQPLGTHLASALYVLQKWLADNSDDL
jgi:hypothetical protein